MSQNDPASPILPPPPMKVFEGLTEADIAEIQRLQQQKMQKGQGACELCGVNAWTIDRKLWTPIFASFIGEAAITTNFDRLIPMVVMICGNCGNAKFLHARQLGFSRVTCLPAGPPLDGQ